MGSSRPAFWDRQSSTRKEISRLPEIKSKTIAFVKRWSFLLSVMKAWIIFRIADCILLTLCILLWIGQAVKTIIAKKRPWQDSEQLLGNRKLFY